MHMPPSYVGRGGTLIALGRVASVPTVWSHCLAGWWLGGAGHPGELLALWFGATCLYFGGTFLNDACDAEYDAIFRRQRPIASGEIELRTIWLLSLAWLGTGLLTLMLFGKSTAVLALLLATTIVLYDALHKIMVLSPLLLAVARFLLYLVGASAAAEGITGLAVWSGLALASYATGLHYFAQNKKPTEVPLAWPIVPLAVPLLLAWLVNGEGYRWVCCVLSLLVLSWFFLCLRYAFGATARNIVHTGNGLVAGMVLLDFLAVAPETLWLSAFFAPLFLATLALQRLQPAH